jgi:DNA-binding NtrC family response regulator
MPVLGPFSEDGVLARFVGRSSVFEDVLARLPGLARADGTVLITGETGTGKELVARALHQLGPRAPHPFLAVSCGSLVDARLESELFGHAGGAFAGARSRREGLIAHAATGTLFLDEAEMLTPRAQVALLRVMEERTYRPLGAAVERRVDVRFVAATNDRLDRRVRTGTFRADLYYRLCVFTIGLPPLRERRDDILPLSTHFLAKHGRSAGPTPQFSARALEALVTFDWPGNVRELESAIVRAVHVAKNGVIDVGDLGLPAGRESLPALPEALLPYKIEKQRIVDTFDRHYLTRLMTAYRGNVSRAARAAGKERRDLGKLLKRRGVDPRRFAA